jgi:hypothetical protein
MRHSRRRVNCRARLMAVFVLDANKNAAAGATAFFMFVHFSWIVDQ